MNNYFYKNYVQVQLDATLAQGATSLTFSNPSEPHHSPPGPLVGRYVLIDSLSKPTAYEIIGTSAGVVGNTMSSLTRGLEGTTDVQWPSGTYLIQVLTASVIEEIIAQANANQASILTNTTNIGTNSTAIADHETRITTLESSSGGPSPFVILSALPYSASIGDRIMVETSASGTIVLPGSPTANQIHTVEIIDYSQSGSTITVDRNGRRINGQTSDLILDYTGYKVKLEYINATFGWLVTR